MSNRVRVLHVDDDSRFGELTVTFLEREDERFDVETVPSASEGLDRLDDGEYDCVVSDYEMPGLDGITFLESVRESDPDLPFILFTGKGSEEVASDAISAGATDYLQKESGTERYELLANRIDNAVTQYRATGAERRLMELAENTNRILYVFEHDWSELLFINSAYEEVWGRSIEALREDPDDFISGVHPDDRERVREAMETMTEGDSVEIEYRVNAEENFGRWVRSRGEPIVDETGTVVRVAGFTTEITVEKQREGELRDARLQLKSAEEAGVVGTWEWDIPDDTLVADPEFARLFGVDPDAARSGVPITRFTSAIHEADRDRVSEQIDAAVESCGEYGAEYRVWNEDDELRWIIARGHVECDEDGSPLTFPGSAIDITDQKRREQELLRTERRFEAMVNDPNILVGVIDTDGTVIDINRTAMEYVDAELDDVIGDVFWETPWWSEDIRADIRNKIRQAAAGEYVTYDAELTYPDDEPYSVTGTIRPVTSDRDEVESLIVSARDVTERKRSERRLQRQNERFDTLARIVSHDLQSPIVTARGRAELAIETGDTGHMERALTAMEHLDDVRENLVAVVRSRDVVDETEPVDVGRVAAEIWAAVEPADAASLQVEDPPRVAADPDALRRLIGNLLTNSVEHGGDDVTITLGGIGGGFYLEDDGPGIPPEERADVFVPGFSTKDDGSGVGMASVEQIVLGHGWDISIREGETGGARFEITGVERAP